MGTEREYTNNLESRRFGSLQSSFAHFRFYFPAEARLSQYIRARRALINERGLSFAVLNGQAPGRASWQTVRPRLSGTDAEAGQ